MKSKSADPGNMEEKCLPMGYDFSWFLVAEKVKMDKPGEPVTIKTNFG